MSASSRLGGNYLGQYYQWQVANLYYFPVTPGSRIMDVLAPLRSEGVLNNPRNEILQGLSRLKSISNTQRNESVAMISRSTRAAGVVRNQIISIDSRSVVGNSLGRTEIPSGAYRLSRLNRSVRIVMVASSSRSRT